MKIGLKAGARGANVQRLHRILLSAHQEIEQGEVTRHEFGPSTLAALQAFQALHRLRRTRQINEATLKVLIEVEQNITVNVNEAPTPTPPKPAPGQQQGVVRGKVVDGDGAAITDTRVSLFSQQLRVEEQLADATTDKQGQYTITYRRPNALNLLVRAYDRSGKVIAESATLFGAAASVTIDLTTAADGVVRAPSRFTTLQTTVAAQLGRTPLADLKENKGTHELTFLAKSIGAQFDDVAYLFLGDQLGTKNTLQDATLFGIFYQGIPASLDAALASLPDAGIDDAFATQVMSGVLAHSRSALSQALAASITGNIIPPSYAGVQDRGDGGARSGILTCEGDVE